MTTDNSTPAHLQTLAAKVEEVLIWAEDVISRMDTQPNRTGWVSARIAAFAEYQQAVAALVTFAERVYAQAHNRVTDYESTLNLKDYGDEQAKFIQSCYIAGIVTLESIEDDAKQLLAHLQQAEGGE